MSARVCGTRLEAARDDDRTRTILLSDLHVGRGGGAPLEWLETVLADARREPATTRVLILGDLFEFYATDAQLDVPAWDRVPAAIAATVAAGVPVTVLHGNRDFLLGRRFAARSGARVVAGGLRLALGGRPALAIHGDELCWRDRPYMRTRPLLRSPVLRVLQRVAPAALALRVAGGIRRASVSGGMPRSPAPAPRDQVRDEARFAPVAAAVDELFATGVELVVFGHVHRAATNRWPQDGPVRGVVRVLPAFDVAGEHLRCVGGELFACDVTGGRLPDPPPWRWT